MVALLQRIAAAGGRRLHGPRIEVGEGWMARRSVVWLFGAAFAGGGQRLEIFELNDGGEM